MAAFTRAWEGLLNFFRTSLFIAVLVMASASARAENWIEIDRSAHATAYVDKDSAVTANGHVTYVEKHLFDAPHPIGVYKDQVPSGPNYQGAVQFVEMRYTIDADCKARTATPTLQTFYDANGKLVSTMRAVIGPKPMGPNSIALAGAKVMCPQL